MRYIPVIILLLITVLARGFVRGTDEAPAVPALTPFEIEQMPYRRYVVQPDHG